MKHSYSLVAKRIEFRVFTLSSLICFIASKTLIEILSSSVTNFISLLSLLKGSIGAKSISESIEQIKHAMEILASTPLLPIRPNDSVYQSGRALFEVNNLPPKSDTIISFIASNSDKNPDELTTYVRANKAVGHHQNYNLAIFYVLLFITYVILTLSFVWGCNSRFSLNSKYVSKTYKPAKIQGYN